MRIYTRIFRDPDSDPEQDLFGMMSNGVDHPGLLLMMYPRPVFVAAAVLDFFPIEGTHQTVREVADLYSRFHHGDRMAMTEGYHGQEYSSENHGSHMIIKVYDGERRKRWRHAAKGKSDTTIYLDKRSAALLSAAVPIVVRR